MKSPLHLSIPIAACLLFTQCSYAQEENTESSEGPSYELNNQEKEIVDTSLKSFKVNQLKDLYSETAKRRAVNFDRKYVKEVDYSLRSTVDFNHPSLGMLVTEITEDDFEAIQEIQKENQARDMRNQTLMQAGFQFSYAAAYYSRTREKYDELVNDSQRLHQAIPFHILTLAEGRIKPAVILEIPYTEEIEDKRTIRTKKRRYRIDSQAEVILKAPTYLDYYNNLLTPKPSLPSVYMIPLTDEELVFWRKGVMHGWVEGNAKANIVIEQDTRKMFADFVGMIRYRALQRANVLTTPTFKKTQIGTNSRGDIINIGESIFEITSLSSFNDDDISWITLPEVDDIFGELTEETIQELTSEILESGSLQ
jgi:defect-in-organelle-trafficking protein DotC